MIVDQSSSSMGESKQTHVTKIKLTWSQADKLIAQHTEEICSQDLVSDPVVSVCILTYNHRDFIREALDGVLIQQTDFPFEIIIGDDASTDSASEIIDRYQLQHVHKIKILRSTGNLGKYTGNGRLNLIRNLGACRGKYIAFLEGDDYWTNPLKLQKQVDCLELNPSYAGSCHDTVAVDTDGAVLDASIEFANQGSTVEIGFDDTVSNHTPFHTSSFVIKSEVLKILPEWILNAPYLDRPLMHMTAMCGMICRIPEVMSHYRKHPGGATRGFGTLNFRRLNLSFIYHQMHYFAPNGRRAFEKLYRQREKDLLQCMLQCNRINEYFKTILTLMRCCSIDSAWRLFIRIPRVIRCRIQVKIAPIIPAFIKNSLTARKK